MHCAITAGVLLVAICAACGAVDVVSGDDVSRPRTLLGRCNVNVPAAIFDPSQTDVLTNQHHVQPSWCCLRPASPPCNTTGLSMSDRLTGSVTVVCKHAEHRFAVAFAGSDDDVAIRTQPLGSTTAWLSCLNTTATITDDDDCVVHVDVPINNMANINSVPSGEDESMIQWVQYGYAVPVSSVNASLFEETQTAALEALLESDSIGSATVISSSDTSDCTIVQAQIPRPLVPVLQSVITVSP